MTTITVPRELIEQAIQALEWCGPHEPDEFEDLTLRKLRAALAQQAEPSGWRPISTAPKDGTAVLLCWARDANGQPINWHDDPPTAGVFVQSASWWGEGDGWVLYCGLVQEPRLHFTPTHWQPLPDAPKEGSNG